MSQSFWIQLKNMNFSTESSLKLILKRSQNQFAIFIGDHF